MKGKSGTAFIVELLLMFVLLLMVIVVITRTVMMNRSQSLYARHLTEAVILAESTAEVVSAAGSPEEAAAMIAEMAPVTESGWEGEVFCAKMDFTGEDSTVDHYRVTVRMTEEAGSAGTYIDEEICVYFGEDTEPIYTLTTGNYIKEGRDAA